MRAIFDAFLAVLIGTVLYCLVTLGDITPHNDDKEQP